MLIKDKMLENLNYLPRVTFPFREKHVLTKFKHGFIFDAAFLETDGNANIITRVAAFV